MADYGAIFIAAIAAASTTAATISSAQGARANADAQQKWADYNAAVARQNAEAAQQQAESEAKMKASQWEQAAGKQRALMGMSGMAMGDEGSSLMATEGFEATQKALDVHNILYRGDLAIMQGESQAGLMALQGQNAQRVGNIQAGQSLMTGLSSIANLGMNYFGKQNQTIKQS